MRDPRTRRDGIAAFLFGQVGDAIADIRGKLIEEGWFGRRAHEPAGSDLGWSRPPSPERPTALGPRTPSFEEQWAVRSPAEPGHEPKGHEIDR